MARTVNYTDGVRESYQNEPLGSGGRGQVFQSLDGKSVFKLFAQEDPETTLRHRSALEQVVNRYNFIRTHPYWSGLFSWPDRIAAQLDGQPCLGVRMAKIDLPSLLRTMEYSYSTKYYHLLEPEERGWWIGRVAIAIKLARAIAYLESNTLAHTDISPRNILANPFTGQMSLIDCDGIVAPGTPLFAQVVGTPQYQAPELVSGERRIPTAYTDRHALAVMLYRLLLFRHPLLGPRRHPQPERVSAEEEDRYLLGDGALFIEDPNDDSNRPRGLVLPASTLGRKIETLIHRAFVTGLHQPGNRPLASEWEDALTRLYDRIVPCSNPQCLQRFFALQSRPGGLQCSMCGWGLQGPDSVPYFQMHRRKVGTSNAQPEWDNDEDYIIIGWPGRYLHIWHLATDVTPVPVDGQPYMQRPLARFEYDPYNTIWYLTNDALDHLELLDFQQRVPQGACIELTHGLRIRFGLKTQSRMATVRIVPMPARSSLHRLPESDQHALAWPTIAARRIDLEWTPGQPISLDVDKGL